jgi:hypothetical protein
VSYRFILITLCTPAILVSMGCLSSVNHSGSQPPPIQFISPTTSPAIDQGQTFNVTVSVTGGGAVTWSLQPAYGTPKNTPIGTLSNQTNTSVTYTACSGSGCLSPQQLTIVATAGNNSAPLAVTVNATPTITVKTPFPACPPTGQAPQGSTLVVGAYTSTAGVGTSGGTASATVNGGTPPFSWSIASGVLPTGLNLVVPNPPSTAEAAFTGTPLTPGCPASGIALQVTDATGVTATSAPVYLVVVPVALSFASPPYSNGLGGISYDPTAFQVKGGTPPYTLCTFAQNALPVGLQMLPVMQISVNGQLCSSAQTSPNLVVYGTTSASNELEAFSPSYTVTDSEVPYPATGALNLSMLPIAPTTCDPTAVSIPVAYLQPGVPQAFQLRGFDSSGPVVIQGSFTVNNAANPSGQYQGTVTGGEEDIIRASGSQTTTIVSGSYSNQNGRGCLTLTNSAGATTAFQFTLSGCPFGASQPNCSTTTQPSDSTTVCGQETVAGVPTYYVCLPTGRIIEFDNSDGTGTVATGILRTANSSGFSGGPNGSYAFGLSGWDSIGGRYATAGSFSASSTALSSVAADINDAGALQSALTGGSGTFSSIDSSGRATATLTVGSTTLNLVSYMVSSNELMWSTTGSLTPNNPFVSGEAIGTSGSFSNGSLQNTHMFHIAGYSPNGVDVSVGVFAFDGIGDVTGGTVYQDQAGTLGTTSPASGNYAVDSTTGRVSFSTLQTGQSLGAHTLVGYVIPPASTLTQSACTTPASCVTGFLIGTTTASGAADASAQAGTLEFQTSTTVPPPPFGRSSVAGYYAFAADELLDAQTPAVDGYVDPIPSAGNIEIAEDVSYGNTNYCKYGGLSQTCNLLINNDQLNPSSYSVNSSGTGTLGGETVSVTNGSVVFYINESPLNLIPSIMIAEQ